MNALRERILEHARRALPEECVGLLLGREQVEDFVPLRNLHPAPHQGFCLDAAEVALHLSKGVIGLYHSHPNGGGEPSCFDEVKGFEFYWIVDPRAGTLSEIKAR
ncbi:hypothetical protein ABS71_16750 [bacterium SCN 62-11]|nr:Mov34/MPN/PAD-1 family protein [Candidatus Eremiobacteraeota bacterium]ODT61769.1 MAG: hypothetical protein ABS71_16750 [bacterium SCN 62-11]